jgi:hypothetical protein
MLITLCGVTIRAGFFTVKKVSDKKGSDFYD